MPRKPNGDRAMTAPERNAALRVRKAQTEQRMRLALQLIAAEARTLTSARAIAAAALANGPPCR